MERKAPRLESDNRTGRPRLLPPQLPAEEASIHNGSELPEKAPLHRGLPGEAARRQRHTSLQALVRQRVNPTSPRSAAVYIHEGSSETQAGPPAAKWAQNTGQ